MKILIYGAGVIGQIYAARLHEAGHDVTILARRQTLQTLTRDGITVVNHARPDPPVQRVPVRVEVTGEVGPDRSFELAQLLDGSPGPDVPSEPWPLRPPRFPPSTTSGPTPTGT